MVNVNLMESRYEKTITYEKFSLVFLTHVTNMTLCHHIQVQWKRQVIL